MGFKMAKKNGEDSLELPAEQKLIAVGEERGQPSCGHQTTLRLLASEHQHPMAFLKKGRRVSQNFNPRAKNARCELALSLVLHSLLKPL